MILESPVMDITPIWSLYCTEPRNTISRLCINQTLISSNLREIFCSGLANFLVEFKGNSIISILDSEYSCLM